MTAVTRSADAILQALIMISNSMRLSFTSPQPDWTMYTSSPRTDSPISTLSMNREMHIHSDISKNTPAFVQRNAESEILLLNILLVKCTPCLQVAELLGDDFSRLDAQAVTQPLGQVRVGRPCKGVALQKLADYLKNCTQHGIDQTRWTLTREDLDVGHPRFFPVPTLVAAALDDGGSVDHLVEGDERRRRSSNRRINFCYSRPEDVSLARCLTQSRWRKTEERGWERAYGRARMVRTGVSWAPPPTPPPLPLNLFLLLLLPGAGASLASPPRDETTGMAEFAC